MISIVVTDEECLIIEQRKGNKMNKYKKQELERNLQNEIGKYGYECGWDTFYIETKELDNE